MFTTAALTILSLIILLFSIIVHELAHAYVAYSLGDPTAKYAGRLTLNPLKHLDPFGSIILPLFLFIIGSPFLFGWAKPVPINPNNFRGPNGRPKYGELKVSLAGPLSNILLAVVFGLALRFVPLSIIINNPGLLLAAKYIIVINLWLAIFNLIPVPPLDGSWILFNFLPVGSENLKNFLRQYGTIILVILILFGGRIWFDIVGVLFKIITGYVLTL